MQTPPCVLCFLVFFHQITGHDLHVFYVFLCFFINVGVVPNSNGDKHDLHKLCALQQDLNIGAKMNPKLKEVKRGPVDCANNVMRTKTQQFQ